MGLLSNTTGRAKVIKVINKYGSSVGCLMYFAGFFWMALLAHHEFNAKRYFSENQLLPGMVDTYFSDVHYTYKILKELQEICTNSKENNSAVRKKILAEFDNLGLDFFTQSFSLPSQNINGTNVFGIYPSPRASGVESIVFNVPYHGGCQSFASIAMMLSIAKYFRKQTFWAKDIIFLVTEHNVYGINAWLEGYFQDHSSDLIFDNLEGHGGSIQAAIILDLPSESFSHLDISIQGLNGMLPNLDLVHVIVRIAYLESVPVKLEKQKSLYLKPENYWKSLVTLIKTMAGQATGLPSGNHGVFYKYRIEAYTLKGAESSGNHHSVDFESLGRLMEGIFRSINNLLEHVHQSFFLYLLPNTDRYISIGLYMPPLGCLVAPLLVCLLQTWISIFQLDVIDINKEASDIIPLSVLFDSSIPRRYVIGYITSAMLSVSFVRQKEWLMTTNLRIQLVSFISICFIGAVFIRLICGKSSGRCRDVLKLCLVLHLATIAVLASITNFSAAFVITALYVPLVYFTLGFGRVKKLLHCLLLPITSPPVLFFIVSLLSNVSFENDFSIDNFISESFETWRSILELTKNYHSISLWTANAIFTLVTPLWLLSASTLF